VSPLAASLLAETCNTRTEVPMAKKQKAPVASMISFDVLYEDGSRLSNRKLKSTEIDEYNEIASAKALLQAQDREIASLSGRPRPDIKTVMRSGK